MAHTKRTKALARRAEMEAQKRRDDATVNLCGAQRHDGKFCAQRAGWGTEHVGRGRCRHHGGQLRSGFAAAADEEMRGMAKPTQVSPARALSGVLRLAAGQLIYASGQVAELQDDELFESAYSPTEGVFKLVPHHWLKLQRDVMNDVARYAKLAADAGVAEREQQLAEGQTAMIAGLLEKVVGSLDLSPEQREQLGPSIRRHLSLVEVSRDAEGRGPAS
ncbi:MAG: hypothetical protein H0U16_04470 [Actinobacteria bacterium]|nr:hypothetical protein [Actinomycetota bacterium]